MDATSTNVAAAAGADAAPAGAIRAQALVGVGTLAAAAGLAWGALSIPADAGYSGVGPNFLPWVVTGLLSLCGLMMLREALTGGFRELDEIDGAEQGDWSSFAWVSSGILLNATLITSIGFVLSCALCYVLAVQGFRRSQGKVAASAADWLKDIATGVAISAPVFWMFTKGLAISLPGLTQTGWI